MTIREIELHNFKTYEGTSKLEFAEEEGKNVVIISGKNGFGKTTFLMSLVWCMYGKNMQEVDEIYKKEIHENGGYNAYISNALNRNARANGETTFSVSLTFTNIQIPEILCRNLKITRSFNTKTKSDEDIEILVDGFENELAKDIGPEMFIRDFLMPIEIAKFFFFDAEKIVNLAEVTTSEQRRNLSSAYSEVLGIKKYEDLKKEMVDIQLKLRQESANATERAELLELEALVRGIDLKLVENQQKIKDFDEHKSVLQKEIGYSKQTNQRRKSYIG